MLEIDHLRRWFSDTETIGRWTIKGEGFCFTLEDPVRKPGVKIAGDTAIPCGRYKVVLSYSPKFRRELPEVLEVPGFTAVRIHAGNGPEHTEGCILLGENHANGRLIDSAPAVSRFLKLLKEHKGEAWLNIKETMTAL